MHRCLKAESAIAVTLLLCCILTLQPTDFEVRVMAGYEPSFKKFTDQISVIITGYYYRALCLPCNSHYTHLQEVAFHKHSMTSHLQQHILFHVFAISTADYFPSHYRSRLWNKRIIIQCPASFLRWWTNHLITGSIQELKTCSAVNHEDIWKIWQENFNVNNIWTCNY